MHFKEFTQHVKEHITQCVPSNHSVTLQSVPKNNGQTYVGLVIINPDFNISPTIYLEPFYQNYVNGTALCDIYDKILNIYHNFAPSNDFDVTIFTDYNLAKHRIIMKLVNLERNAELLKKIPYIPFLDLAIVFLCSASDFDKEYASILIHNEHMQHWGIDVDTLYQIAQKNSQLLLPFYFENMENFLIRNCNWSPGIDHIPMYLLSNHLKINGASAMIYEGLLDFIANKLNSDFVIIPSSIHEVLIIPATSKEELPTFTQMLCEVNTTQLLPEEILSDQAYYYSKDTHMLS